MKQKLLIIITLFVSLQSSADTSVDMLNNNVSQKPSSISLNNPEHYEAEAISGYEGRNKNANKENLTSQVKTGSTLTRTIQTRTSSTSSQVENLESTAGELVQKLEDDRLKKSKKHKDSFEKTKTVLQDTYKIIEDVDVNKLGSEQDPGIQNAFKCLNIEDCNKNPKLAKGTSDARAIKNSCNKNQRLHWDGSRWSCVGIFATISSSSCGSKQYSKPLNGGIACIDYVYEWGSNSYTNCDSSGNRTSIVKCFQKKELGDKNITVVSDSNCLGAKPNGTKEQCTSSWNVGSWSACSKTCGGGVKRRSVTCPTGYKCTGTKPVTSVSCNTQPCKECKFQQGRTEWVEGEDYQSGATWTFYRWNGKNVNPFSADAKYTRGAYMHTKAGSLVGDSYYKICRE